MWGIEDLWVWLGYVLAVASVALCLVYALVNWNRDDSNSPSR